MGPIEATTTSRSRPMPPSCRRGRPWPCLTIAGAAAASLATALGGTRNLATERCNPTGNPLKQQVALAATLSCDHRRFRLMWRTKFLIVAFIGLLGIAAVGLGVATSFGPGDSYPVRPITVVVPFPAGGPSDVVARVVTEQMGKILGQSLVIENVGGGGGTIGSARVAAAPSDGYTLLAGSMGSHVAAPVLTANLKYDPAHDFTPIGFTAQSPAVIVARKDFPANNLRQFVDYLKQNP